MQAPHGQRLLHHMSQGLKCESLFHVGTHRDVLLSQGGDILLQNMVLDIPCIFTELGFFHQNGSLQNQKCVLYTVLYIKNGHMPFIFEWCNVDVCIFDMYL